MGDRPPRPVTPTTILADELTDICRSLAQERTPIADVAQRLNAARDLAAGLDPYVDTCASPETADLARIARRTHERDWSAHVPSVDVVSLEQEMLSGHVEGQFLKFLVWMTGARRILEVGMFTGYSAFAMAEAAGPDGSVTALEIDQAVADFARVGFGDGAAAHRISTVVGPAGESLASLDAACRAGEIDPFDLVFIDADKGGYRGYVQTLLDSKLLADRAVIAVDNTLMQGQVFRSHPDTENGRAIAVFNAWLADEPRVEQVLIPLRDGVTLIRRTESTTSA